MTATRSTSPGTVSRSRKCSKVLAGDPDIRRDRKNRAGTHVALGQTNGGRRVVVPLVDEGNGRVRPISAWEVGT